MLKIEIRSGVALFRCKTFRYSNFLVASNYLILNHVDAIIICSQIQNLNEKSYYVGTHN